MDWQDWRIALGLVKVSAMTESQKIGDRIGRLARAMRENPPLIWSFLYFFCLLTGYYVLRPVRDAMGSSAEIQDIFPGWFIQWATEHGIALSDLTLQVLFSITFIVILSLQPFYSALVSRFSRRVFLPAVYAIFIACLLAFYFVFDSEMPGRGVTFFVWVAVFNLFAVTVFWSFMADIYTDIEARKLYGYIGAGGTLGGFLGPLITRTLVEKVGVANLLLVSVFFIVLCLLCILKLSQWAKAKEMQRGQNNQDVAMGGSIMAGFKAVFYNPLMRAFALLMFCGVGVGTLLYSEQAAIARLAYPLAEQRTEFFANIDLAINILSITIQLLLTRFLLMRYGVAKVLLIPAFFITLGFAIISASPLPFLIAVVQVMTRAGEFSVGKPARETIYTRVDRETRYKAKAFIDTAVYRGGDLTFVWLHKAVAVFGSSIVFLFGVLVALGMGLGAWKVGRQQEQLRDESHQ
jgi:ATP:ADP antiporter, AAA family